MKKTILALSAAALALTGTTAIAQYRGAGHNADANGDGTVTLAEMQSQSAERFARMDANGDGKLSLEELASGFRRLKAAGAQSQMATIMTMASPGDIRRERRRREQEQLDARLKIDGGNTTADPQGDTGISYAEIQSAWRGQAE